MILSRRRGPHAARHGTGGHRRSRKPPKPTPATAADRGSRAAHPVRTPVLVALGLFIVIALGVGGWFLLWPRAKISSSRDALAQVELRGAGTVVSTTAVSDGHAVALTDRAGRLTPTTQIPMGASLRVTVVVRMPSWLSWLTGARVVVSRQVVAPTARLLDPVVVELPGQAVLARFSRPVAEVEISAATTDPLEHLSTPVTSVPVVGHLANGQVGVVDVAAVPQPWEVLPAPVALTYFGTQDPTTTVLMQSNVHAGTLAVSQSIRLTLSRPVADVFGHRLPTFSPAVSGALVPTGSWTEPTPYSLEFQPSGPDFWPGEQLTLHLPAAVSDVVGGGKVSAPSAAVELTGAAGSTLRLQQLLAILGYLPVRWTPGTPAADPSSFAAQAALISASPPGSFAWRWSAPSAFTSLWVPGVHTVMTHGAVIAFEKVAGLDTVGQANPLLWPTLLHAVVAHRTDPHPYAWIEVSKNLPERLWLYSNGKMVLTSLTNTGISPVPTPVGTFAIYLRYRFQIMRGTNPDGSSYADPVSWINYFYQSDAVHGFPRASYGFPQSVGCVELPIPVAAQVWPQVHIGTLVTVLP